MDAALSKTPDTIWGAIRPAWWALFGTVLVAEYAILQWAPSIAMATPGGVAFGWLLGLLVWFVACVVVGFVVRGDEDARLLLVGGALLLAPLGPATSQLVGVLNARWDQRPGEIFVVPCRDVSRSRAELRLELSPRSPGKPSIVLDATPWRSQIGSAATSVLLLVRPGAFGFEWIVWVRDVRRVREVSIEPARSVR